MKIINTLFTPVGKCFFRSISREDQDAPSVSRSTAPPCGPTVQRPTRDSNSGPSNSCHFVWTTHESHAFSQAYRLSYTAARYATRLALRFEPRCLLLLSCVDEKIDCDSNIRLCIAHWSKPGFLVAHQKLRWRGLYLYTITQQNRSNNWFATMAQ